MNGKLEDFDNVLDEGEIVLWRNSKSVFASLYSGNNFALMFICVLMEIILTINVVISSRSNDNYFTARIIILILPFFIIILFGCFAFVLGWSAQYVATDRRLFVGVRRLGVFFDNEGFIKIFEFPYRDLDFVRIRIGMFDIGSVDIRSYSEKYGFGWIKFSQLYPEGKFNTQSGRILRNEAGVRTRLIVEKNLFPFIPHDARFCLNWWGINNISKLAEVIKENAG